jgi:flagellar L-ring protein precursor FlgH
MKRLVSLAALLSLVACGNTPPKPDPAFSSVRPVYSQPLPVNDGGIYRAGYEMALFADQRARRIGDIITIVLVEKTNASKKASTKTKKDSSMNIGSPSIWGGPVTLNGLDVLAAAADAEREFTGEGDSTQSNSLTGRVSVTVIDTLPNGNLVVRGEKLLTLNQGSERVQVSGTIRPADVSPDNTVLSTQVADAQIVYTGEGALADANSPGWMARFFQSSWWPF